MFLFSASLYSQTSTDISVVSAEKLNVVYRGVPNPIKIAVPGAKSFTATAEGLEKVDDLGKYILKPPGNGAVVIEIDAVMCDGTLYREKKIVEVKGLPAKHGTVNGHIQCQMCKFEMSKAQLSTVEIGVAMENVWIFFPPSKYFGVTEFTVKISQQDGTSENTIKVSGNTFNAEVLSKVRDGSFLIINDIKHWSNTGYHGYDKMPSPITISINEYE